MIPRSEKAGQPCWEPPRGSVGRPHGSDPPDSADQESKELPIAKGLGLSQEVKDGTMVPEKLPLEILSPEEPLSLSLLPFPHGRTPVKGSECPPT